jgi:flagellar basal body-associated protein FliL
MTDHHQTTTEPAEGPSLAGRILLGVTVLVLLIAGIFGALWINGSSSATDQEDAERAAVRVKNLAELQASDTAALTTYGWNDRTKGIVHIPITKAIELVLPTLNSGAHTGAPQATTTTPSQP